MKAVCPSVEKAAWQGAEDRPLRMSAGFILHFGKAASALCILVSQRVK